MSNKELSILTGQVEKRFLPFVRRPSRYLGGEINQIRKDLSKCELTVALCFPDIYEVGMSNLGFAIIYDALNRIDSVAVERVFAPWIDAEDILRREKIPLFSLESKAVLKSFSIVGFSLTNELCYTNVLNMLDLGGIGLRSCERMEDEPIVIGGGGQANCCEPIADFFDLFILGEGDEAIVELVELIRTGKAAGLEKKEILLKAAEKFEWVYVPSFYRFKVEGENINSFEPVVPALRKEFKNAVVEDFENAAVPLKPIVPFTEAVHERVSVEIMRGCPGRCRFCQASFCRRPIRYRSVGKIIELAKECYKASGFDTVSLLSLSTADYPYLDELTSRLQKYFEDKKVGISLPSLRVDQQLKLLPKQITSVRKGGLTIAVESASEKVREIINKPIKDKDLFAAVKAAYECGWQRLKLYFMVGLPGEGEEDIKKIAEMSYALARLRKEVDNKTANINVAVSWFVPKAHTPFGWLGQRNKDYFEQAKQLILNEKKKLRAKFLQFKFHNIKQSILESAIGRGGRELSEVIESAWREGAKFDLWDECFNYTIWEHAFERFGYDIDCMAQRAFGGSEILPWEHLGGPGKKYLSNHLKEAEVLTKD